MKQIKIKLKYVKKNYQEKKMWKITKDNKVWLLKS